MSDRPDIPLEEVIADALAGALLDLHTALPGIVKAYNATTGCVDVQPAVKRALEREDGTTSYESLPVIQNVRVCWPGAGGFELHLPLAPGDTVWLMFAEADMQKWESNGQEAQPGWLARHGLGSCVAYPFSRTAKATTGGARMVTPTPFTFGNEVASKLVAQADKVDTRLNALKSAFAGWTPVPNDGGAALKVALGSWLSGTSDTGCTRLKAE